MTVLSAKPATDTESKTPTASGELLAAATPGARLKKARLEQNLEIAETAEKLHLSPGVVKALEADDFQSLPNATFVKGYLRSYARLLDISGEELVRTYESILRSNEPKPIEPVETQPERKLPLPLPVLGGAGLFLVLLLVWVLWPSGGGNTPVEEPQVAAVAQPQALESESAASTSLTIEPKVVVTSQSSQPQSETQPNPLSNQASATPTQPTQPLWQEPQPTTQPEIGSRIDPAALAMHQVDNPPEPSGSSLQAGADNPAQPLDAGLITMAFSGDCWVEIRDASGELIYSDLKRMGESLRIKGTPPLEAKLGNGNVASLTYNGQPVSFRVPRHNVVRVQLGE